MFKIFSNTWALFLGLTLIMLGNGLQGTLLGIRATLEGLDTSITGLVMSGYFIGLIIGCYAVPKAIANVGHVRVFGALASIASTSILVQGLWVEPFLWWAMRLVTGFSYAGLYIVVESWLNDASDNNTRGKMLSIYMVISLGSMAGGQFLLNLASPETIELFILTSLLVSWAVVPMLITATHGPNFETPESVSIVQLFKVSPLGVFGMFASGVIMGVFFGMGSVFTTNLGLSVSQVSLYMSAVILGGFISQYPLGWLSDRIGRRQVILGSCIVGSALCIYAGLDPAPRADILFFALASLIGGMVMPLYALCSAHVNDYLTPQQMVAASGTLVLVNAVGAAIGSPVAAASMDHFGPSAFYLTIAVMSLSVVVYTLWRSTQRTEVGDIEPSDFVMMAPTPLSVGLNLDVEEEVLEEAYNQDAEEVQESFEELTQELEELAHTEPDK
ncbi:MAG: MFS transporter [Proteobacteria bacterium]|nr:MAG: MFS transporter [Pseudomonadota bacterium]